MKLKLTLLFFALTWLAMAQNFHGVTIGGTPTNPTLINPDGNQPVLGYVAVRHTDNGIDVPILTMDINWIARNRPLAAGSERSLLGLTSGYKMEFLSADKTTWMREGEPTGYELWGILFADGSFLGTDIAYNGMAAHYAKVRSVARALQVTEDKYVAMARSRTPNVAASIDDEMLNSKIAMSVALLQIRDELGEQEAEAALARLAALPDVVKGE